MLQDMVTTMANGFLVCVTQDPVGMSCPCPARSRVQKLCTVRCKATILAKFSLFQMVIKYMGEIPC